MVEICECQHTDCPEDHEPGECVEAVWHELFDPEEGRTWNLCDECAEHGLQTGDYEAIR